jgi:hypothetical protein
MFGEIREEGSHVSSEEKKAAAREIARIKRDERKAIALASGEKLPRGSTSESSTVGPSRNPAGRPKSIVNRVTEYGALFNKLNEERIAAGLPQLKTAMEVLIDAMQSDELDVKDKARIADKLAPFESSRAPVISIEHVQNISKEEDITAEDAMDEFLNSLRKV